MHKCKCGSTLIMSSYWRGMASLKCPKCPTKYIYTNTVQGGELKERVDN